MATWLHDCDARSVTAIPVPWLPGYMAAMPVPCIRDCDARTMATWLHDCDARSVIAIPGPWLPDYMTAMPVP